MMPATATEMTAVMTGTFLSGAMMSLSLIAVPVLLDTATTASHLSTQWTRMYHYGHRTMPTLAVGTFVCYISTVYRRRSTKKSWKRWALAGVTTLSMLPFTWLCMAPTNNELFQIQATTRQAAMETTATVALRNVEALIIQWSWLHIARTLLPLAGAVMGMMALLKID